MTLAGKTALITGGGTGIGLGGAQALHAAGCKVAIAGRREEVLKEAAATCDAQYHTVDVADQESVKRLFQWAESALGPIDILINSAGINIPNRTMAAMEPEQWDKVMRVNAYGAYYCMHAVLPSMKERGDGLIINISSIAGKRAAELGGVAYCASKFAMTGLGTAVANEVAEHGIRVTNIYPGEVNTPILENRPAPVSDERKAAMLQMDDMGHMIAAIAALPPHAHVAEMVIKPLVQHYI